MKNDEIAEGISDRIDGRVPTMDVVDPSSGEILVAEGEEITPSKEAIEEAGIDEVE